MMSNQGDTTIVKSSSSTEADAGIFDPTTAQDLTKIVLSRSNSHAKAVPRRFKTAYIFFTIARNKEIREMAGLEGQKCLEATEITREIAKEWRSLSAVEKAPWIDMATADKKRYMAEKQALKKHPGAFSRDPTCPKRPASAFLAWSNSRKKSLKKRYPSASNGELSRTLATMWKSASVKVKQPFQQEYEAKMNIYRQDIAKWRKKFPKVGKDKVVQANSTVVPCASVVTPDCVHSLDSFAMDIMERSDTTDLIDDLFIQIRGAWAT